MKTFLKISCLLLMFLYSNAQSISFNEKEWNSTIIGISVRDISNNKIIFEKNSHLQLCPASTFKLLTTSAALEKLGANYQFKTEFYYVGELKNRVLSGNLIIKTYGDPTIESRFFKNNTLNAIVLQLKQKLDKITGKIIIDNSFIQSDIHDNWIWEDINNYYAAIPYSTNIYDNEFHIYLQSQQINTPIKVLSIQPQYHSYPKIEISENSLTAQQGGDNAYIYGDPLAYTKRLKGSIPPFQKEYSIEGVLPDPPRMFAQEFIKELNHQKIILKDTVPLIVNKDSIPYTTAQLLYTHYSPPLSEIVRLTNLHSINLFAECIVYALGNGNYNKGKKEIIQFLKQHNINTDEVNIDDGCGLSRLDGVSADALTQLLSKVYQKSYFTTFWNSLPVAGESGTMKNFATTPPLANNLRCKTGYVQRVRTYAGYLKTKSGKTLAVAVMFNNFNVSIDKIKQSTKAFFEMMYND